MLKKHMAACLVASAFITMPVLAQTSTSPGATSPGASQPATGASGGAAGGGGAAASGGAGRFITEQQTNQWRASRLIGIDVYGADNQKIGDINEVLVDRQGNADAVVVGVGGFLGIGEKNVALPFNAFEWQMDDSRRTAAASGTGSSGAGGAGSGAGAAGTGAGTAGTTATTGAGAGAGTAGTTATTGAGTGAAGSPATRGDTTASTSAAGGGSASGSAARSGAERGYPDHAVLRMSKADLENAPTFRYVGENRSEAGGTGGSGAARTGGSGAGGGSATGTGAGSPGTAPRQ